MARTWRIVLTGEGPSLNDKPFDIDAIVKGMISDMASDPKNHQVVKTAILQEDGGRKSHDLLPQIKWDTKEPADQITEATAAANAGNVLSAVPIQATVKATPLDAIDPEKEREKMQALQRARSLAMDNLKAGFTKEEAEKMIDAAGEDLDALEKLRGKKKEKRNPGDGQK